VCCVVKADGYGHGATELAKIYESLGADYFAVSNIDEAKELRDDGINLPIVILGYTDVRFTKELADYNIDQTVFSFEYAKALSGECIKNNVNVNIHIKVDSGMSRIGFMCQEFPRDNNSIEEIYQSCQLKGLNPVGIFTHFCVSDEGEAGQQFTYKQYSNFTHTVNALKEKSIEFKNIHCSNSGAIEDYRETYNTMVRAGIILYGLAPSEEIRNNLELTPVMTVKSVVAHIKTIEKGASVSYGRTFVAEKNMKIATIPIGYADGYLRSYAKDGYMVINGVKAKILGRVCMDQTMVDVSNIDNINVGDEVIVFGSGEYGEQTATDLAKSADTINYEVVCTISKRVPRYYINNGQITKVMYKL
jgi:alanine racemase